MAVDEFVLEDVQGNRYTNEIGNPSGLLLNCYEPQYYYSDTDGREKHLDQADCRVLNRMRHAKRAGAEWNGADREWKYEGNYCADVIEAVTPDGNKVRLYQSPHIPGLHEIRGEVHEVHKTQLEREYLTIGGHLRLVFPLMEIIDNSAQKVGHARTPLPRLREYLTRFA